MAPVNRKPSSSVRRPVKRTPSGVRIPSSRTRKRKRKTTPTSRSFLIVIALLAVFTVVYQILDGDFKLTNPFASEESRLLPLPESGEIRVYFFDVGQGDSILLQSDKNSVLIDAGEYSTRNALLSYLRDAGVKTLDYLIATHPHADHIGGMVPVLENFTVKNIVLSDATANTETYESFLGLIEEQKIPVTVPEAGDNITSGIINLSVLAPLKDYSDDLNNASLVLRMVYGETAFLFAGDAEAPSEQDMLNAGGSVRADIIKIGHHGSNTASTGAFIDAVRPSAAVISCGKHNSYNHPHDETLEALASRNIPIYRTDESASIIMNTDGQKVYLH